MKLEKWTKFSADGGATVWYEGWIGDEYVRLTDIRSEGKDHKGRVFTLFLKEGKVVALGKGAVE